MTSIALLYCPYPTLEAARAAAMGLLEARLVACCNLLPVSESLYWWQGKLATNPETVLLAKTTPDLLEHARTWIATSHPYDTPAVLSFMADANPGFSQWVSENVGDIINRKPS